MSEEQILQQTTPPTEKKSFKHTLFPRVALGKRKFSQKNGVQALSSGILYALDTFLSKIPFKAYLLILPYLLAIYHGVYSSPRRNRGDIAWLF